jgi:hypothetical protein
VSHWQSYTSITARTVVALADTGLRDAALPSRGGVPARPLGNGTNRAPGNARSPRERDDIVHPLSLPASARPAGSPPGQERSSASFSAGTARILGHAVRHIPGVGGVVSST